MEVHVISREIVKPSQLPPPNPHPKTYELSQLDQLFLDYPYAPITLFYPPTEPHNVNDVPHTLDLLKKSLSETLTRFYPLAGKIKDDVVIDCNDQGAYFVETHVNVQLNKLLGSRLDDDLLFLYKFLPCHFSPTPREEDEGRPDDQISYLTNIQVNVFECGGLVIGLCMTHRILDGAALSTFLHGWASIARGSYKVHPKFIAGSLFPARDLSLRSTFREIIGPSVKFGHCITKRFVFDGRSVSNLKAEAASSRLEHPTRVEAVSALLWKCMMAAAGDRRCGSPRKPSLLHLMVNLRRRVVGDDWDAAVGNLMWFAAGKSTDTITTTSSDIKLDDLAGEIRKATSKVNNGLVREMMGDEGSLAMSRSMDEMVSGLPHLGSVDYYGLSSWCKMGYYDTDFGWGRPIWVTPIPLTGSVFPNLVMLVDTRCGQGIEAWVSLEQEEMSLLLKDLEILKYASIDPSPLQQGSLPRPSVSKL